MPSAGGRYARRAQRAGVTGAPAVALALALGAVTLGVPETSAAAQTAGAPASTASTPPSPTDFVTDGAGFLSAAAQNELEQRLARYERDTGHQVLLWIGQTTGGEPIEPWAVRAFAAWRVGRKGLDDGVVVFIMAADRRLRIEVGYGVEDRLPDAVAARIIGDQMVPRLRAGDQDGAARAGVSGVLAALGGESGAPRDAVPAPEIDAGRLIVLGIIGILVLGFLVTHPRLALMLLMTIDSHRNRGGWGGGSWGGGFGGGGFGGGGFGGGGFGGGGGFSGGGGRSGGGGASGSW